MLASVLLLAGAGPPAGFPGAAPAVHPTAELRSASWQEEMQEAAADGKQREAEGWEAFRDGSLVEAERLFRAAVEAGRWQAWRGVAECARREQDWAEAARAFESLLEHDPGDVEARLDLARTLSWSGRHAEAELHFRRVIEEAEDEAVRDAARRGLHDNAAWGGRHRAAWKGYRQTLNEHPQDLRALRGLAELETWKGRHGHAALHFRRAEELAPGDDSLRDARLRAEAELAPTALLQLQHFSDNADWSRFKALGGVSWTPLPGDAPGWRLFVGAEEAEFEQADGSRESRTSLVTLQTFQTSPFTELDVAFESGRADDENTFRGGIAVRHEADPNTRLWASWRHDDFIDPVAPHAFDRYNGAFTVDLERTDILQANTWRGGLIHETAPHRGVLVDLLRGNVEDGNQRFESYLQGHRGREWTPDLLGIARVFHHHSDYDAPSTDYFSPSNLDSWGVGGRLEWERDAWESHADAAAFWQASGVDSWGYQLEAGVHRRFARRARVGLQAHFLSTDERGLPERYESFALLFAATFDF